MAIDVTDRATRATLHADIRAKLHETVDRQMDRIVKRDEEGKGTAAIGATITVIAGDIGDGEEFENVGAMCSATALPSDCGHTDPCGIPLKVKVLQDSAEALMRKAVDMQIKLAGMEIEAAHKAALGGGTDEAIAAAVDAVATAQTEPGFEKFPVSIDITPEPDKTDE